MRRRRARPGRRPRVRGAARPSTASRSRVLRRPRLVEEEQAGVPGEQSVDRARGRDALRLTAREAAAARPERGGRVELDAGQVERTGEQRRIGVLVAEAHVRRDRAGEQRRRLPRPGDRRAISRNQCATVERAPPRRTSANPSRAARRLDLPDPLSPVTATTSPGRASRWNPSSTVRAPRRTSRPEMTSPASTSGDATGAVGAIDAERAGRTASCPDRFGRAASVVTPPASAASSRSNASADAVTPCGRCVEGGADVAQRQEHLGREHEHEEPRREGHVARRPAGARSRRRRARPTGSPRTRA